ncbi:PAS domain-containing protein, partial [Roseburia faecis]|nr:PAS domain-containing protein [Roseburia faecis]
LIGYDSASALYHSTLELQLWVDPQERRNLLAILEKNGFVRDFTCNIRHKEGQVRLCEISSYPLLIGADDCILTIVHDITETTRC